MPLGYNTRKTQNSVFSDVTELDCVLFAGTVLVETQYSVRPIQHGDLDMCGRTSAEAYLVNPLTPNDL
jgi:hypothetical protein